MVSKAIEAADILKREGINARLINIHTIKPIDRDIIIKAATETGAIVTCEEQCNRRTWKCRGGVLVETCPVPMRMVGVMDRFGKSGKPDELLKMYGLTAENIVEKVKEVLKNK